MADQSDDQQWLGIKAKVQEGRKVPEERRRQVPRLIQNPERQPVMAAAAFLDSRLDIPPELGAPVHRFQPQGQGQTLVEVLAAKVRFGQVDDLITMGIESPP